MICPGGGGEGGVGGGGTAPFSQEIQKLFTETLQNMEAWSIKALKAAPISRKLEIAQNAKNCSKQKKLLEIRKVAKKLPGNLWQALPALNFKRGISVKRFRYLPGTLHFRAEIGRLRTRKKNCEPAVGVCKGLLCQKCMCG